MNIAAVLGEKPGNLLPNDMGDIAHLKPLIDRLATIRPEVLPRVTAIIEKIVLLTEDMTAAAKVPSRKQGRAPRSPTPAIGKRKGSGESRRSGL